MTTPETADTSSVDVDVNLDSGATLNVVGSNLTADDVTRLRTAIDSLNPTNLEDVRAELTD